MNKRQKKKYKKNHIFMTNLVTGKTSAISVRDFVRLLRIADFSAEQLMELFNSMEDID